MSLEEVLTSMLSKLEAMTQEFDILQAYVVAFKAARERANEVRRSRRSRILRKSDHSRSRSRSLRRSDHSRSTSRSPKRTPCSRRSLSEGTTSTLSHSSWAEVISEKASEYDTEVRFPDEGDGDDAGPLT